MVPSEQKSLPVNPVRQGRDIFLRRTGLPLRGHRTGLDLLRNGEPLFPVGLVPEILSEDRQTELAFGLVTRVTALAVV